MRRTKPHKTSKKLEKLEPKTANKSDRDMSMMVITIIIVSILVAFLLASMEGDFELWMIAPGAIIGALIFTTIVGPRMDVEVKIPDKVKDEISKLKEKLARREVFEVAIDNGIYLMGGNKQIR